MTIREQLTEDLQRLIESVLLCADDGDVATGFRRRCQKVYGKLCEARLMLQSANDGGPTAADIAGEVVHDS